MEKYFDWSPEKNEKLMRERGISFEHVVVALNENRILDIVQNKKPRAHQKLLIIEIDEYAYIVPFVEDDERVFFKTIYPSHKHTKQYLQTDHEQH